LRTFHVAAGQVREVEWADDDESEPSPTPPAAAFPQG
jgi:hypothetical protein